MRKEEPSSLVASVVIGYALVSGLLMVLALAFYREKATAGLLGRPFAERLAAPMAESGPFPGDSVPIEKQVILVFQPADCPGVVSASIPSLNALAANESVAVKGLLIPDGSVRTSVADYALDQGIAFELQLADEPSVLAMFRNLGYSQTPLVLILGPENELRAVLDGTRLDALRSWTDLEAHT